MATIGGRENDRAEARSAVELSENKNHPIFGLKSPIEQSFEQVLPAGSPQRKGFDHICKKGGDPKVLFSFLTVLSIDDGRSVWQLLKMDSWSRTQWKNLPVELLRLAKKTESVTKSDFFTKAVTLYWKSCAPDEDCSQAIRRKLDMYQHLIPQLLRDLQITMQSADFLIAKTVGPKRFDTRRYLILRLVSYVRKTTGEPRWADVGRLLDVDPDLLKKLSSRAAKYGLLPKDS